MVMVCRRPISSRLYNKACKDSTSSSSSSSTNMCQEFKEGYKVSPTQFQVSCRPVEAISSLPDNQGWRHSSSRCQDFKEDGGNKACKDSTSSSSTSSMCQYFKEDGKVSPTLFQVACRLMGV